MKHNRSLAIASLLAVALAFIAPASGAGAAHRPSATRQAIPGGQLLAVLAPMRSEPEVGPAPADSSR